jgi:energy-coupling factor transport system ATP-binding protein
MMSLFYELNQKYGKTVLMVTHDMENVFAYCDDVAVVADGSILVHTNAQDFFRDSKLCRSMNILPPALIRMRDMLNEKGFDIPADVQDIDALADYIAKQVKSHE